MIGHRKAGCEYTDTILRPISLFRVHTMKPRGLRRYTAHPGSSYRIKPKELWAILAEFMADQGPV